MITARMLHMMYYNKLITVCFIYHYNERIIYTLLNYTNSDTKWLLIPITIYITIEYYIQYLSL